MKQEERNFKENIIEFKKNWRKNLPRTFSIQKSLLFLFFFAFFEVEKFSKEKFKSRNFLWKCFFFVVCSLRLLMMFILIFFFFFSQLTRTENILFWILDSGQRHFRILWSIFDFVKMKKQQTTTDFPIGHHFKKKNPSLVTFFPLSSLY